MLAICIDFIGDKSGTYKLLRNYPSLAFFSDSNQNKQSRYVHGSGYSRSG